MDLFYHVVGINGASDFNKSVRRTWTWEEIEPSLTLPKECLTDLRKKVKEKYRGAFSIWGVPRGAERVWKRMREGNSYVLLVTSISIHDPSIRYGGIVDIIVPDFQYTLSRLLWQSERYPLIYFFSADFLNTCWFDFRDALGFEQNYRPPARLFSVREDRVLALCNGLGLEAYLNSIRLPMAST